MCPEDRSPHGHRRRLDRPEGWPHTVRLFECVRAVEESSPETSYPFINEVRPGEMLVGFNHVLKSWHGVQAKLVRISERALLGV